MKKKFKERAAIILLSFILVFSNTLYLYADEIEGGEPLQEEAQDPVAGETPQEEEPSSEPSQEEEPQSEPSQEGQGGNTDDTPEEGQGQQEEEQQSREEEEKRQQEEEERRQQEEEERRQQEEEERRQQEEEERRRQEEEQKKQEEEQKKQEEEQKKQEEEQKKESRITVDNPKLSFGTITTADSPRPLSFVVKNEGNTEISLGWSQTDTSGIFALNMPSNVNIPIDPGAAVQGSVEIIKDKLGTGDYSTTIIFSDLNNTGAQAKTEVSIRVEKAGPRVDKVRISPGSISIRQGKSTQFKASVEGENNPDTSVSWSLEGADSGDTYIEGDGTLYVAGNEGASSFTVIAVSDADTSVKNTAVVNVAAAEKERYVVNADVDPSDAGYINGRGTFNKGDRTTLTAVAYDGYKFKEWVTSDGGHVSSSASFTTDPIDKDLYYKALFKENGYEIKVKTSDSAKGTVEGGGFVEKGDDITIKAKPKSGYYLVGWYEKDKLISKDEKLKIKNVKKAHTFTAEFSKEKYVVVAAASPKEGGTVTGGGEFKKGETTVVKASNAQGYHFKGFVINNNVVSENPEYKIKDIDRDINITAWFEKDGAKNHKIVSGVANKGGAISPSGEISVTEGSTITCSIAPDNGYGILAVAVDGVQIGAVSSYTFENVKGNHSISVAFAPKENSVNDVKMDKIISTAEAKAIAVARLEKARKDSEERESRVITPEEYQKYLEEEAAAKAAETEADTQTLSVAPEQNLVGMDDADGLGESVNTYNPDTAVGVYQALDITEETAEMLIDSGADAILINEAYELGYLDILINNEYMVPGDEGDILEGNNTVHNLQEIIRAALTKEDKLKLFKGNDVMLSFTISGAENPGAYEKEVMKGASGVKVDEYLYITLMKSVDGVPSLVEKLDTEMEITMEIPENLRDSSKSFCIVRNHNGEVDVLEDQDDDPNTITIKTDRFSPYAIAHHSGPGSNVIIVGATVAATLLLLITAIFVNVLGKKKKR